MAMAATEIDTNGVTGELEFKSPDVPMDKSQEDHAQALDSFDNETPALTMETSTGTSSTASLYDNNEGESDNDLEELVEIDESSVANVIKEICPEDGFCIQCEIEQPCSFQFTDYGETLYVCNEPCIKAYQAKYPGKYTVTRKKYLIEEISPKTLLCSECEEKKTCYFYHNFHGEDTFYCSLNCLELMMSDEKDKYTFSRNSLNVCIDQIRPIEGQCLICEKVKPCEFSLVRYGEHCFLCERTCIKILSGRERVQYYIKKLRVSKPAVSNAIDKNLDEGYKIQENTAARVQREQSLHRRCSQCTLILMIDENVLTWEAMDFCNEICLEMFQNGIGSKCAKCNNLVQHTSLGKYCVRFGFDIRQFCDSSCLEEFKKGLKICFYCQRDISTSTQVFIAPVGDNGQFKDFCTQSCVEKIYQMSRNPVPQPVWAKCAVCSLEKATTIQMEVTETASHRICSDPCFAAYKFANNILPDQCKWCKKYFERKSTKSFTTCDDSNPNCFCSQSCVIIHINHTKFIVSCNWCKSLKYNYDMIRRVDNGQVVMMCSLNCMRRYKKSANELSSSNGVSPPTLAPLLPSIEQSRADETALAVEPLITLSKSRKRGETTQRSRQKVQNNESPKKIRFAIPDSPRSGQKKVDRSSRIFEGMIDDLPVGTPLETPKHPKKKRVLPPKVSCRSLEDNPWYQLCAGPFRTGLGEGGQGSSELPSLEKYTSPRAPPFGALTPAIPVGKSNTPRGRRKLSTHAPSPAPRSTIVSYGSEEDSDGDDNESCPYVSVPRTARLHLQDMDEEEEITVNSVPVYEWPPRSSTPPPHFRPAASPPPPALPDPPHMPFDRWHFEWRPFPQPPVPPTERRETFAHRGPDCGPQTLYQSPYEAFTSIWSLEIMGLIARETNRYAQEVVAAMLDAGSMRPDSRIRLWKDTTTDELYMYFAVILATGITVKSRMDEYWSKDRALFSTPLFSSVMGYDRFQLISKCLHFADNSGINQREMTKPQAKLFKIKPIIDHLNDRFSHLYKLTQNIALDESLTQWKGWLDINQFIKNKAATVGVKTYELCESNSGYLWRFEVHAGHDTAAFPEEETPVSGITSSLVLRLLKGLEGQGYTVWMDNFYNSPALARELKSRGFDCVGTLRTNRQYVPKELANLTKRDMVPGQIVGCTSGDVDCVVWRGKNCVALVSTYHGLATWECSGIKKPTVVQDYNICMGGVDRKDQMLAMYPIERKRTRIWYKKLFRRLVNASTLNAYIMYRKSKPTVSHRDFRKELCSQLLSNHSRTRTGVPPLLPAAAVPQCAPPSGHFPAEFAYQAAAPGKRLQPLRRFCKVCKKRTQVYCEGCDVPLCLFTCFKQHHLALLDTPSNYCNTVLGPGSIRCNVNRP